MKIEFVDRYEYIKCSVNHLTELKRGQVIINAYHEPDNFNSNVGIYLVATPWNYMNSVDVDNAVFVINLRTQTTYTFAQMRKRFMQNGFYLADIEQLQVSIRKRTV